MGRFIKATNKDTQRSHQTSAEQTPFVGQKFFSQLAVLVLVTYFLIFFVTLLTALTSVTISSRKSSHPTL